MIIPILHRILVKPDSVETVTADGIILAINEKREQAAAERGTVVSVGDTVFKDFGGDASTLKVGDKVAYAKYAGKTISDGKEDLVILNDEDIVAIIRD